jgi:hypothetical protein
MRCGEFNRRRGESLVGDHPCLVALVHARTGNDLLQRWRPHRLAEALALDGDCLPVLAVAMRLTPKSPVVFVIWTV